MKNVLKRAGALLFAFVIVLGMLPAAAFAAEELYYTVTIGEETTSYTDLTQAFAAACAAEAATLKLYPGTIDHHSSLTVYGGDVTLDLNGGTVVCGVSVTKGTLTIKDSGAEKGTIRPSGNISVVYFGGKLIIDSSADACGEAEGHDPWGIYNQQADTTVTVGCTGTEDIVLPENCLVIDDCGIRYDTLPAYTPAFFHRHTWSKLTCTQDKACSSCGMVEQEAPGHSFGSDGVCTVCDFDLSKTITINMTDQYGDGWNGNGIEVYEDGQLLGTATVKDGLGESWACSYDSSKIYNFKWILDSYPDECVFEISICGETVYTASEETCAEFADGQLVYTTCIHDFDDGVVTPPTCTEEGFTTYTCSKCSGVFAMDAVSATGHSFGSDGICTVCDFDPSKIITINMIDLYGDDWSGNGIEVYEDGQLLGTATVENGREESWTCDYDSSKSYTFKWIQGSYPEDCSFAIAFGGEVVFTARSADCTAFGDGEQIYPVCAHTLEITETVAPNCTGDGYTIYTCTLCGGVWEKDQVDALGHSKPEDGITVTEATCTMPGMISYTCTVCGDPVSEVTESSLGHIPDDSKAVYVEPTCTTMGFYSYICDRCDEQYNDDYEPAIGHILGADGSCTACGELYSVPVAVSGVNITSQNMDDVLGDGTVSYDPQTNTLTLNEYSYSGTEDAVYSEIGLNIELIGNNTVITDASAFCFNVYKGSARISGTGTLEAQTGYDAVSVPDTMDFKLTIGGGVRIRLEPGEEEGIKLYGDKLELEIRDHAVLELGSEDAPLENECIYMYGETYAKVLITNHASITFRTIDEEGIYAGSGKESAITVSGNPTVDIISNEESMFAADITISGGSITACSSDDYRAIYADNLTIAGGTVTVNSGGLCANNALTLAEGMVITEPANATIGETVIYEGGFAYNVWSILDDNGLMAESLTIAEADAKEKFDIDVSRMILGNSLDIQFGVAVDKIPNKTGFYAVIEKQWADGTVTETVVPATRWTRIGSYWAITYSGLAAKEMNDTIRVTVCNADGEAVSNTKTDSVCAYVVRAFDGQDDAGKTMLVDMLRYGSMAQQYFGYNTDELATMVLTGEQQAYGTASIQLPENQHVAGDHYYGTRLVMKSRIGMQVAFEGLTRQMYAVYTYTDAAGTAQEIRVNGSQFVTAGDLMGIELHKLVYADARTEVTVTVYNADGTVYGTVTDSMAYYARRFAEQNSVAVALVAFADSVKAYFYG